VAQLPSGAVAQWRAWRFAQGFRLTQTATLRNALDRANGRPSHRLSAATFRFTPNVGCSSADMSLQIPDKRRVVLA
jgi:hypothetical protein